MTTRHPSARHAGPASALYWLALLLAAPAFAEPIEQALPSGTSAVAEFLPGDPALPAMVVIHGFLTTSNFNTIRSLVDELSESGYTVLAPTLTLGIQKRRGGLACDAIHTHTMDDDVREIRFWVDWLVSQGHERVVLISHSSGGTQTIAYADGGLNPAVTQLIILSLAYADPFTGLERIERQRERAQRQLHEGDSSLARYSLYYCKENFVAPPHVYLSYTDWSRERVLEAVKNIPVPIAAIMGGADNNYGSDWAAELRETGIDVTVVDGASHFFDATHEFDLHEAIHGHLSASD